MATQTNRLTVVQHLLAGRSLVGRIKWFINKPIPGYQDTIEPLEPVEEYSVNINTVRKLYEWGLLVEADIGDKAQVKVFKLKPDKIADAKAIIAKMAMDKL